MAKRAPDALNALPIQWVYLFQNRVKKGKDAALRRRVLEIFAADSYQPVEVGADNNFFRGELAIVRAGAGDTEGARALIAGITQPSKLLQLSLDPRTRALIPANFDIRAATERELARRRDIAASHPNSLNAVVDVANSLRWLGRYEEALAGLEAASPEGPAGGNFTDRDKSTNWWWDAVGYANAYLGRYDAALAAFRHGIDAKEEGAVNVSQSINLANQQQVFGRDADAIKTLAPLGDGKGASPYGVMQLMGVRGCSRFRTGDKAGADADYAYAKAHDSDAPATVTGMALCRNDLDEAAAALVRRLTDPDLMVDALLMVSDFDPPPAAYPKQIEDERLELVKMRPEVKAAIAKAGGARRFNLRSAPF
jgi:tetratricopeptide (TPR) repeat protein